MQSAVSYLETDSERQIRETLEPASVDLTRRIVADNITGMPEAARVKDRGTVAQSIFDRSFSLMRPAIEKSNDRLIQNLQARGIPVGAEAFNDAYGEQQKQTQETLARLAMDADVAAGSEQSRQFGLDQAQRSGAIAELIGAMTGQYTAPNSVPSGSAPQINYSGLVSDKYQADLAQAQSRQNANMQAAQTIGSLGTAMFKCTRDSKIVHGASNTALCAAVIQAIPLSAWTYKPDQRPEHDSGKVHVGPMAEDFHSMTSLGRSDVIDPIDYLGVMASALQNALRRIAALEMQIIDQTVSSEAPRLSKQGMH